ncbi:MAG: saccharopine dehydrogenase NADP-binding domain-containing protein [Pseudomonadota bacterium]
MAGDREFDIIVYGATGYTGRLVAEYLAQQYAGAATPTWAMAGRSADKLASVRDEIGAPANTPLVVADVGDPASIDAMAKRAKVILTTVGPYQLYGEPVVAACAANGADYVDLSGEVAFMYDMIAKYDAQAKETGARIVHSGGFDSIPFDMGVYFLQQHAIAKLGAPLPRIRGRVRSMNGTFSGGTFASGAATMAAVAKNPELLNVLRNPFALADGFEGPEQPHGMAAMEEPDLGWVGPFVMATINTRNIHRSNKLMDHIYGADFVYDEMMCTGPGEKGQKIAEGLAKAGGGFGDVKDPPKPGEGPSKEEREAGNYDVVFIGEAADGTVLKAAVTGDKDPGYGSTSKIIAEAAMCLIEDVADKPGGVLTPAPIFGDAIIKRLRERAGLTFELES